MIDQPPLRLIVVKAETFPDGIKLAFDSLEGRLVTLRGRKFYGVTFKKETGFEYYAGLVPDSESEERKLGLPILEIMAGQWVRSKLMDWPNHTDQIGLLIGEMIKQFGIDPDQPTLEFYRSQRELHLLVPLKSTA